MRPGFFDALFDAWRIHLALMQGQFYDKGCALALFAFHPDGAAVEQHQLMHDGKAQARSTLFPAAGFIHPIETIEDMGQIFLGNAGAIIHHGQLGFLALPLQGYLDLPAALGIFHLE